MSGYRTRHLPSIIVLLASVFVPGVAQAHCDGLDGPVVAAARKALTTGKAAHVLIWVKPEYEAEVKRAFIEARSARASVAADRNVVEMAFFETVVRLHRAGEGAPYTGLQPAGRDLGLALPAADRAIESASAEALVELLTAVVRQGLEERFRQVLAAKKFPADDLAAGRAFVRAYTDFVHLVERIDQAAGRSSEPGETHQAHAH